MANYYGAARSNFVLVKDMAGLRKSLSVWPITIEESEGKAVFLSEAPDGDGWPSFAIGADGEEIAFSFEEHIMPFIKEGEVLVVMEAGAEKLRYLIGWANAYVRSGTTVKKKTVSITDIYRLAARAFRVPVDSISEASY